jgi:hypothetical protein
MKRLIAGLIALIAVLAVPSMAQATTTPTPSYSAGNPACPSEGLLWQQKFDPPVVGWNGTSHKVRLSDAYTVDAINMSGTYDVIVIVKGGNGANVYSFNNIDDVFGLALRAPVNASGSPAAISHVTLCKYGSGENPPPPVYDCEGNELPPGSTPPTEEECNPPEPTCQNTPSLCPPVPPVTPPTPPTPPVTPPTPPSPPVTPPTPPEPEVCTNVKAKKFLIGFVTKKNKVVLKVVGPKKGAKITRQLDGKKVGRVVSRKKFDRSHIYTVRIVREPGTKCQQVIRKSRLTPHEPPGPPQFTG